MTYGCFNRKPITTFGATTCQYTLSEIGKVDKKCEGCNEKESALIKQYAVDAGKFLTGTPTFTYNQWSDCA